MGKGILQPGKAALTRNLLLHFYSCGKMQSTALLLLFIAVSASAELGSQIIIGIGLKITGEQEDEMIMCKGDVIKSNC